MPAGGALLHNGLTFHGAGANMTPGRRRAMTVGYMPDGSTFNGTPNILPPDDLTTLQIGERLDNESQNPLVYRRYSNGSKSRLFVDGPACQHRRRPALVIRGALSTGDAEPTRASRWVRRRS